MVGSGNVTPPKATHRHLPLAGPQPPLRAAAGSPPPPITPACWAPNAQKQEMGGGAASPSTTKHPPVGHQVPPAASCAIFSSYPARHLPTLWPLLSLSGYFCFSPESQLCWGPHTQVDIPGSPLLSWFHPPIQSPPQKPGVTWFVHLPNLSSSPVDSAPALPSRPCSPREPPWAQPAASR